MERYISKRIGYYCTYLQSQGGYSLNINVKHGDNLNLNFKNE